MRRFGRKISVSRFFRRRCKGGSVCYEKTFSNYQLFSQHLMPSPQGVIVDNVMNILSFCSLCRTVKNVPREHTAVAYCNFPTVGRSFNPLNVDVGFINVSLFLCTPTHALNPNMNSTLKFNSYVKIHIPRMPGRVQWWIFERTGTCRGPSVQSSR